MSAPSSSALINYTTLIVVGLYLVYGALMRFIAPQPVQDWLIVIISRTPSSPARVGRSPERCQEPASA